MILVMKTWKYWSRKRQEVILLVRLGLMETMKVFLLYYTFGTAPCFGLGQSLILASLVFDNGLNSIIDGESLNCVLLLRGCS